MKAAKRFMPQERETEREGEREGERNQFSKKKSVRKKTKKSVSRKKLLMHHLKVILMPLLKDISSEIIHAHVAANAMNNELLSIYSQTVEQIEVISEVVLSNVSKLIDSEIPRDKETKGNKIFLRKKGLHKIGNGLTINKHTEISYLG